MKNTSAIINELYPIVSNSLSKNVAKYRKCIERFIDKRADELYDTCPNSRIYFGEDDIKDLFDSLSINKSEVTEIITHTYYSSMPNFNPRAAKDEFTVVLMMVIRYFYLKKMKKELELSCIYLSFSGKFYPSVHYMSFPKVQPKEHAHIMNYVINNELSNRFALKTEGNVIGAIKSICITWLDTYENLFKSSDDEDIVYLIDQLHNRIKSFMKNIAELYYKAYNSKDSITFDSDNTSEDSFRLADNDSLKVERILQSAMDYINTNSVDYKICRMSCDSNVKVDEVKSIIESILGNNDNMAEATELMRLLISVYFANSKDKDVSDIKFITFCISPKPNTKDKNILRQKQIVETWLETKSPQYQRRKNRLATKNSYFKAIYTYFTIVIHYSDR